MELLDINGVHRLKTTIANLAGQSFQYSESWGAEFAHQETIKTIKKMAEKYSTNLEFGKDDLAKIGLSPWDESGLMLIPVWLLPFIASGTKVTSIGGEDAVYGEDDIDNDTRFGCLAYGVFPNEISPQPTIQDQTNESP